MRIIKLELKALQNRHELESAQISTGCLTRVPSTSPHSEPTNLTSQRRKLEGFTLRRPKTRIKDWPGVELVVRERSSSRIDLIVLWSLTGNEGRDSHGELSFLHSNSATQFYWQPGFFSESWWTETSYGTHVQPLYAQACETVILWHDITLDTQICYPLGSKQQKTIPLNTEYKLWCSSLFKPAIIICSYNIMAGTPSAKIQ